MFVTLSMVCTVLIFMFFKYKKVNYNYWKKRNVLQIDDLIWQYLLDNRSMSEICKSIYDKYDAPYIGTSMGSKPALILKNMADIKAVLASNFECFHSRGIQTNPEDILADNLLFMEDYRRWKLLRQKLSPIFTNTELKNMFYIVEKCARDFVEVAEDHRHLRQNPFSLFYTYTTASIGATLFGIDTQSKNSTMYSPFLDMAWKSVKPSWQTNIQLFITHMCPYVFKLLNIKKYGEHEKFFVGIMKNVLEYRRKHIRRRYDFLDICASLQYQRVMMDFTTGCELYPTDELLAAQAFSLFIAGTDTTANAFHFTLIELSNNSAILKKLHEELDNIFGIYKEELTYTDIDKLPYLDMVVSEALRKYPPVGFIQRLCTKDTILPSTLMEVQKDTIIAIPVFAIHRDEKYYPSPEVFDPERFCRKKFSKMSKFSYLPFGEGNRICIGRKFAHLQLKTGLAWLLRRFTLAEQKYTPKFEKNPFTLRDPDARYLLIPRDLPYE